MLRFLQGSYGGEAVANINSGDVVRVAVSQITASVAYDLDDVSTRLGWEDATTALEIAAEAVAKLFADRIDEINQRESDRLAGRRPR